MRTRKPILPNFARPDEPGADENAELRRQAEEGLARRIMAHGLAEGFTEEDYRARLDYEIGIIQNSRFPSGYFLIVPIPIPNVAKDSTNIARRPRRECGLAWWPIRHHHGSRPLRFVPCVFERFLKP